MTEKRGDEDKDGAEIGDHDSRRAPNFHTTMQATTPINTTCSRKERRRMRRRRATW